jgi:putative Holliday junction resolvase
VNFLKILGIDLGLARTGLAIADSECALAFPIETLSEANEKKLIKKICEIIKQKKIEKIVLGLPKNMNGTEGQKAKSHREFAQKLKNHSGLDVFLQDERCTTVIAHEYLSNLNVKNKNRKKIIDTVSATIILQDYLETLKNAKN